MRRESTIHCFGSFFEELEPSALRASVFQAYWCHRVDLLLWEGVFWCRECSASLLSLSVFPGSFAAGFSLWVAASFTS